MTPFCRGCGSHLSDSYARVLGDQDGTIHRCLHCDSPQARVRGSTAGVDVEEVSDKVRDYYGESAQHGLNEDVKADGGGIASLRPDLDQFDEGEQA